MSRDVVPRHGRAPVASTRLAGHNSRLERTIMVQTVRRVGASRGSAGLADLTQIVD
jgi:hypothetical protein